MSNAEMLIPLGPGRLVQHNKGHECPSSSRNLPPAVGSFPRLRLRKRVLVVPLPARPHLNDCVDEAHWVGPRVRWPNLTGEHQAARLRHAEATNKGAGGLVGESRDGARAVHVEAADDHRVFHVPHDGNLAYGTGSTAHADLCLTYTA